MQCLCLLKLRLSFGCKREAELGHEDFHYSNSCCFFLVKIPREIKIGLIYEKHELTTKKSVMHMIDTSITKPHTFWELQQALTPCCIYFPLLGPGIQYADPFQKFVVQLHGCHHVALLCGSATVTTGADRTAKPHSIYTRAHGLWPVVTLGVCLAGTSPTLV
jgi:hypothetical protein